MAILSGEGVIFKFGTAVSPPAVIQVTSISLGAVEQEAIDTFALDSDSKTSRPNKLPDFGSLSVSMFFDPVAHSGIRVAASDADEVHVVIEFPGGTTNAKFVGVGFITSFEVSGMEVGSNLTADVEIKLNELTFTAAT